MSEDYEYFMKLDTTPYIGEWVGICDKKIVSHSKSFKEAYTQAKKACKGSKPFVAMVPPNQTMLL